jgi:hypothetical protein
MGGLLLGVYTMHSFGEYPSEERESLLSQILEDNPPRKYSLSARACQGILRRAKNRGKELPPELEAALIAQSVSKETESDEQTPQDATDEVGEWGGSYTLNTIDRPAVVSFQERAGKPGGGKGILIQNERAGALSTINNQSVFTIGHDERSARFTTDEKTDPLTASDWKDPVKIIQCSGGARK